MKKLVCFIALAVSACAPTPPEVNFASSSGISLKYEAWDTVPTLTAEAIHVAVTHCEKYGKFANYRGGNALSEFSAEELHTFACESKKTDDNAILAAQSKRPEHVYVPTYPVYTAPTNTTCTTTGIFTNCQSY